MAVSIDFIEKPISMCVDGPSIAKLSDFLHGQTTSSPVRGTHVSELCTKTCPGHPSAGTSQASWTENYEYDPLLDYLTDVDYNDGLSNEVQTWTYDFAGNRSNSDYSYDNLNRMTASPGMTYINDAVGNRIARNYTPGQAGAPNSDARMYVWDELNRMTATAGATAGKGYRNIFRADGMRVQKIDDIDLEFTENQVAEDGSGFYDAIYHENKPTTRYFYDGQMCFEDERTEYVGETPQVTKTRYGLGARGIDYISKQVGSGSLVESFPVYDAHGNMVMTISRNGTSFSDGLHRSYDVWGSLRWNPSSSSEVKQRYCANLGHVEDDESGLQYMRARFYEPWTGRFVSEDPAREGLNWFAYCGNMPSEKIDVDGRASIQDFFQGLGAMLCFEFAYLAMGNIKNPVAAFSTGLSLIVAGFAMMYTLEDRTSMPDGLKWSLRAVDFLGPGLLATLTGAAAASKLGRANGFLQGTAMAMFLHSMVLFFYLAGTNEP